MAEFVLPSFLENKGVDDVHNEMIEVIPVDIDMSEGGHFWNMTRPTASAIAMMCEFILPEALKIAFPQFSYDEFLDYHANGRGISRNEATKASGYIIVAGVAGTFIEEGSIFSTAAIDGEPSKDYETTVDATIPESGSVKIPIQCTEAGITGNTSAQTIIFVSSKITGIESVINEESITGGTERETDLHLQERISEYDQAQGESYVGNDADYKRWAKSVDGVGEAVVIPAQDDSGTVTIIITDASGNPANEAICNRVYDFIMSPNDRMRRLAPINASLNIIPPKTEKITISAVVELSHGATIESVRADYFIAAKNYLQKAMDDGEIKLSSIAALLSSVPGINDYKDVKLNDDTLNVPVSTAQLPVITEENIIFTEGVVI